MHDIDIRLLRTFLILAENESFTKTAERIGRSQSAASMQIAKLEEILDTQLFIRDKRNVTLSTDGEKLIGYARQIVDLSDELVHRFNEPDIRGEVRFGSPEDFTTEYLPDILAGFKGAYPRVNLDVSCELTLKLIEGVENGRYDLIVIKQKPDDVYPGAVPMWREQVVWVGPKEMAANRRFNTFINQRGDYPLPLVLSPSPCVYRARATSALDDKGLPWQVGYTSPSFSGVTAAVKAGLGLTVLPQKMVPDDLIPLKTDDGWPPLAEAEICLLARPDTARDPVIHALSKFIRERLHYNQPANI